MSMTTDLARDYAMQDGPDDNDPPTMCRCGHADYCHDDTDERIEVGPCAAHGCECGGFEEGER